MKIKILILLISLLLFTSCTTLIIKKEGNTERVYENGQVIAVWTINSDGMVLKQGEPVTGTAARFHPNGKMASECVYKNSMLSGISKYYYDNGNLKESISYAKDRFHGPYVMLNEYNSKVVVESGYYLNGKKDGMWSKMYAIGTTMEEKSYRKGVVEGLYKHYNRRGFVNEEGYYINGTREGEWKIYDQNRNVIEKGYYKKDKKHGTWFELSGIGTTKSIKRFKDGVEVK